MKLSKLGMNALYVIGGIGAIIVFAVLWTVLIGLFTIIIGLFLLIALLFLFIALVYWASGQKIDIKVGERSVGYVRWFKFYPHR